MWRTALQSGALLALVSSVSSHSFLTVPHPISTMDGCRIGGTGGFIGNCPGPCPNYNIAADADPSDPSITAERGSHVRVVWTRNNHEGGFTRWSLVPLDKMMKKEWHEKMAFHHNCWNVGRFNCNAFDFHRDCNYDLDNEAFSKMLYIPPIYPDGDYVLSWTWYGGGVGSGHFGDYYDCSYVRIEGGAPLEKEWQPDFAAGGGSAYEDGCEATVNELGICSEEPCLPMRRTKKMVPKQFEDEKKGPTPIQSSWYENSARSMPRGTAKVLGFFLVDARRDVVINTDVGQIMMLNRRDELSLLVLTDREVEYVEWYTNGKRNGRDYAEPYTIAGDFRRDFYPWMHPLFNRRIRVSVKASAKDGTIAWGSVELRFQETVGEGINRLPGVTWPESKGELIGAIGSRGETQNDSVERSEHGESEGSPNEPPSDGGKGSQPGSSATLTKDNGSPESATVVPEPAPALEAAPSSSSATAGTGASGQSSGSASISVAADGNGAAASAGGSGDGSSAVAAADMGSTLGMSQGASFATSKRKGNSGRSGSERPDRMSADEDIEEATGEFS